MKLKRPGTVKGLEETPSDSEDEITNKKLILENSIKNKKPDMTFKEKV
jgi:hypothetical protein